MNKIVIFFRNISDNIRFYTFFKIAKFTFAQFFDLLGFLRLKKLQKHSSQNILKLAF